MNQIKTDDGWTYEGVEITGRFSEVCAAVGALCSARPLHLTPDPVDDATPPGDVVGSWRKGGLVK